MRKPRFTETTPGTYRTQLQPAARLDHFPFLFTRPEWKEVPWSEAQAQNNSETLLFIGACEVKGSRQFYFQERGNPEAIVIVRQVNQ